MGLAHIDAEPGLFPVNLTDHDFQVDGRMDVIILAKPPEPANGWAVHAFVFLGSQKVDLDRSHGIHRPVLSYWGNQPLVKRETGNYLRKKFRV